MALCPEDNAEALVEEILRFDPPLHMFTRYAYEEIELCGHVFQRGEEIGLLLGSVGHDEHVNDTPEHFDPARAAATHLAFGAGLHFLRRRAAGAVGVADRAADPVRALSRAAAGGGSTLCRHISFPRAGAVDGDALRAISPRLRRVDPGALTGANSGGAGHTPPVHPLYTPPCIRNGGFAACRRRPGSGTPQTPG